MDGDTLRARHSSSSPHHNEKAVSYGDYDLGHEQQHVRGIETAADTSLHRGLKARHISMIAIGGAIGTGCMFYPRLFCPSPVFIPHGARDDYCYGQSRLALVGAD
jgi:hypothetical protein